MLWTFQQEATIWILSFIITLQFAQREHICTVTLETRISTWDALLQTLSPEKLLHFDRSSISALGQLASTYADVKNQSWFPEGRATVTKGHTQQLQLLFFTSAGRTSTSLGWIYLSTLPSAALLANLGEEIMESKSLMVGELNKRAINF